MLSANIVKVVLLCFIGLSIKFNINLETKLLDVKSFGIPEHYMRANYPNISHSDTVVMSSVLVIGVMGYQCEI